MTISEEGGEIELQALLDLTVQRVFQVKQEVIESLKETKSFVMYYKWGIDGSNDHAQFKKQCDAEFSDSHMFLITVVPLRQVSKMNQAEIVWSNNKPCSTRLSRPLTFVFEKRKKNLH